jgi:hemerythrin
MVLAWDDSLSSGIEEVDNQHKEFIKLIRRIQLLHEKHGPKDLTLRVLHELMKYADYHFASEENIMSVMKYPMIERHKAEHRKLLIGLGYWIGAFEDGSESLGSMLGFLCSWLVCHTRDEDSKIGKYVSTLPLPAAVGENVLS